jgi:hypothetical protein
MSLGREIVNKYSIKIEGVDKLNSLNNSFNQVSKTIDNAEKKAKSFGQSLKDNIFSYKGVAIATAGYLVKKSISDAIDFNSIAVDIKKVKPSLEIDNIKKSLIFHRPK